MIRIIRERLNKNGNREVTLEVCPEEVISVIDPNGYYKLGYPVEDVVRGHVIDESVRVHWCSATQEWRAV